MRRGFTLIETLVVIAIMAILIALLLPAVQQARAAARRTQCMNNLRQVAIGLHNYHDAHQVLPPGSIVVGPAFGVASGWGWGAMLLPFVDQQPLYSEIDFNIGTATPANLNLLVTTLSTWKCPSDIGPPTFDSTIPAAGTFTIAHGNYAANAEMMSGLSSVTFDQVVDGLSNTVMLGERGWNPDASAHKFTSAWFGTLATESERGFDSVAHIEMITDEPVNNIVGGGDCFSSHHSGGAYVALGDGSVHFFSENMDRDLYAAAGTIANGEQGVLP